MEKLSGYSEDFELFGRKLSEIFRKKDNLKTMQAWENIKKTNYVLTMNEQGA
jgi:hypothetical protein